MNPLYGRAAKGYAVKMRTPMALIGLRPVNNYLLRVEIAQWE